MHSTEWDRDSKGEWDCAQTESESASDRPSTIIHENAQVYYCRVHPRTIGPTLLALQSIQA